MVSSAKHASLALGAAMLIGTAMPVAAQQAGEIHIVVANARNARGKIHVDICTQNSFLKDCPYSAEAPARPGRTEVVVRGVPAGRYAAQITHDENSNDMVDRGLFGIPREGVGFSNNVRIRFRAPHFDEAAFTVTGGIQQLAIDLQYFGGSGR